MQRSNKYFQLEGLRQIPKRLHPVGVYNSLAGLYELNKDKYELLCAVNCPDLNQSEKEYARVYRDKSNNQLNILYFPGKDNDKLNDIVDTTEPLSVIRKKVDETILNNLKSAGREDDFEKAKKLFVSCESNTYSFTSYDNTEVKHYIFGSYDGLTDTLKTVDSVDWEYDEKYLEDLFPHTSREKIKRGTQNIIFDNQSCGNRAIDEGCIEITGEKRPPIAKFTQEMLDNHAEYYQLGLNTKAILNAQNKILRHEDLKQINNANQMHFTKTNISLKDKEDDFSMTPSASSSSEEDEAEKVESLTNTTSTTSTQTIMNKLDQEQTKNQLGHKGGEEKEIEEEFEIIDSKQAENNPSVPNTLTDKIIANLFSPSSTNSSRTSQGTSNKTPSPGSSRNTLK